MIRHETFSKYAKRNFLRCSSIRDFVKCSMGSGIPAFAGLSVILRKFCWDTSTKTGPRYGKLSIKLMKQTYCSPPNFKTIGIWIRKMWNKSIHQWIKLFVCLRLCVLCVYLSQTNLLFAKPLDCRDYGWSESELDPTQGAEWIVDRGRGGMDTKQSYSTQCIAKPM